MFGIISLKNRVLDHFLLYHTVNHIGLSDLTFRWISVDSKSNFGLFFKIQFQHFFLVPYTLVSIHENFRAGLGSLGHLRLSNSG